MGSSACAIFRVGLQSVHLTPARLKTSILLHSFDLYGLTSFARQLQSPKRSLEEVGWHLVLRGKPEDSLLPAFVVKPSQGILLTFGSLLP
jgi:hypothetical protein